MSFDVLYATRISVEVSMAWPNATIYRMKLT